MTGLQLRCLFAQVGKETEVVYACRGPMPKRVPRRGLERLMANAASAEEQSTQQVEAPEKDSPLLDLSEAAVKEFVKTAKARGYVTYDELDAVLPSEEVSSEQIED